MRILIWLPLATIIGLSLSLAILLARPAGPTIVLTVVTPAAAAVAPVVHVVPVYWYCGYRSAWDSYHCR